MNDGSNPNEGKVEGRRVGTQDTVHGQTISCRHLLEHANEDHHLILIYRISGRGFTTPSRSDLSVSHSQCSVTVSPLCLGIYRVQSALYITSSQHEWEKEIGIGNGNGNEGVGILDGLSVCQSVRTQNSEYWSTSRERDGLDLHWVALATLGGQASISQQ